MVFSLGRVSEAGALAELVRAVFTASEGRAEGDLVGDLAQALITTTPGAEVMICRADGPDGLIGCALFTRLRFAGSACAVFLLSPLAVRGDHQGRGIGQGLVRFGLDQLRQRGVEVVFTYGDPAYYGRIGFAAVAPDVAQPPFALSQPEGWVARPLRGDTLAPLPGRADCAAALRDAAYW